MNVEAIDADHAIATDPSLLMCLWHRHTQLRAIAELKTIALRHARRGKMAMITVVEAQAEMPSSAIRGELADLFQKLSDSVSCSALVFEGEGFRAATVRGITVGINLVAKQPFPHKVFAHVGEASQWMSAHDAQLTGDSIAERFANLRKTLHEHSRFVLESQRP